LVTLQNAASGVVGVAVAVGVPQDFLSFLDCSDVFVTSGL
jgi:hypothetical protein